MAGVASLAALAIFIEKNVRVKRNNIRVQRKSIRV